jgi:carboxymethylenebutenolidase
MRHVRITGLAALLALPALVACAARTANTSVAADEHAGHAMEGSATASASASATASASASAQTVGLPAGNAEAQARLAASPRHGEWAMFAVPGYPDSVRAWVVYPERRDRAPVVVVIHEIFGLSPWIRAVTDQLAADGFIAVAPDLLTSKNIPGSPLEPNPDSARAVIQSLGYDYVHRGIRAAAEYGMRLPAALPRYGVVGFCWGGSRSFQHAVFAPDVGAAVVYYGGSPPNDSLSKVRAPVLGLYGENDARVNATIPPADTAMKRMSKVYEPHIFPGAGHGFLRAQDAPGGANLAATREAWPLTIQWFRRYLK